MDKRVNDLISITKMGLDVELSKLRRIQDSMDLLNEEIETIKAAKKQRVTMLGQQSGIDFSFTSGADQKWLLWQQKRIAQINIELAALRAKKDIQTGIAKTAFGKNQVARTILTRQ